VEHSPALTAAAEPEGASPRGGPGAEPARVSAKAVPVQRTAAPLAPADLLPLDELAARLKLSPKTLKRLHRDAGLPAFRLVPHGPLYVEWPEIARWIRQRRRTLSTGLIRP
jgi:hypothetical protein